MAASRPIQKDSKIELVIPLVAMSKVHYASCDRANESDNTDYWSATWCGLEYTESDLTDDRELVTCGNCLRVMNKYKKYTEQERDDFAIKMLLWLKEEGIDVMDEAQTPAEDLVDQFKKTL